MARKKQSQKTAERVTMPGVKLQAVYLDAANFLRLGGNPSPDSESKINFELTVGREGPDALSTRMILDVLTSGVLETRISYVAHFTRTGEMPPEKQSEFWQQVVARLAPVILFPYIRETFSGFCSKSGIPNAILPIVNAGRIWDPKEIEIPEE